MKRKLIRRYLILIAILAACTCAAWYLMNAAQPPAEDAVLVKRADTFHVLRHAAQKGEATVCTNARAQKGEATVCANASAKKGEATVCTNASVQKGEATVCANASAKKGEATVCTNANAQTCGGCAYRYPADCVQGRCSWLAERTEGGRADWNV